ncbi:unnamed protein product [Closterium sp. Yama58-4]|nr:unnamed protein product [Closterium sp. Yama58-4]
MKQPFQPDRPLLAPRSDARTLPCSESSDSSDECAPPRRPLPPRKAAARSFTDLRKLLLEGASARGGQRTAIHTTAPLTAAITALSAPLAALAAPVTGPLVNSVPGDGVASASEEWAVAQPAAGSAEAATECLADWNDGTGGVSSSAPAAAVAGVTLGPATSDGSFPALTRLAGSRDVAHDWTTRTASHGDDNVLERDDSEDVVAAPSPASVRAADSEGREEEEVKEYRAAEEEARQGAEEVLAEAAVAEEAAAGEGEAGEGEAGEGEAWEAENEAWPAEPFPEGAVSSGGGRSGDAEALAAGEESAQTEPAKGAEKQAEKGARSSAGASGRAAQDFLRGTSAAAAATAGGRADSEYADGGNGERVGDAAGSVQWERMEVVGRAETVKMGERRTSRVTRDPRKICEAVCCTAAARWARTTVSSSLLLPPRPLPSATPSPPSPLSPRSPLSPHYPPSPLSQPPPLSTRSLSSPPPIPPPPPPLPPSPPPPPPPRPQPQSSRFSFSPAARSPWHLFGRASSADTSKRHYSAYLHPAPGYRVPRAVRCALNLTVVPSKPVFWGTLSIVEAIKRLLANALLDPHNVRFIVLSERDIPLHPFPAVYRYLLSSRLSFSGGHPKHFRDALVARRIFPPGLVRSGWVHGECWLEMARPHAWAVVSEWRWHELALQYCKAISSSVCCVDENLIQNLLTLSFPHQVANRTVMSVTWKRASAHPHTFLPEDITAGTIKGLKEERKYSWKASNIGKGFHFISSDSPTSAPCTLNGQPGPCWLFARKFVNESLPALLALPHEYELGERLGRGQYGVVWRCTDRATGEAFACKYVAGESEHAIRGARREVKSLLRLRGAGHVVALRDVYKDELNQSLYLVMELGTKGDLLSAIERRGRLSEANARRVFRDVVLGVKECHERGVLHRDIKPDNVLLFPTNTTATHSRRSMSPSNAPFTPSGSSLSPFGSSNGAASSPINKGPFSHDDSLVQDYHGATRLGQGGLLLGDYSHNEAEAAAAAAAAVAAAVADAGALSPRSHSAPADIFSLGVTLYAMLSGKWPSYASRIPEEGSMRKV